MPKCACCSNRVAVWGTGNITGTTMLRAWVPDGAAHGFVPIEIDLTDAALLDLAESIVGRMTPASRASLMETLGALP